jgi:hypothetical protein
MADALDPSEAAQKIVSELLSDLPPEKQEAVRAAIETAMEAWADFVSGVVAESGER